MGVGGQCYAPASLPLGKTRYPLYRRLGGLQDWSGWVQKILSPPGFYPQTVQPMAICYTDYAILAHPSGTEVKEVWSYTFMLPYVFKACTCNNLTYL